MEVDCCCLPAPMFQCFTPAKILGITLDNYFTRKWLDAKEINRSQLWTLLIEKWIISHGLETTVSITLV